MNSVKNNQPPSYRGRFAPSPTGPLHFGSLVAALGSYLDARTNHGEWLVRMEDLDQTREIKGSADEILRTLDRFGFEWEGEIIHQSRRTDAYAHALDVLNRDDLAYPCGCTRKEITIAARPGIESAVYPGTCRQGLRAGRKERAIRLRTFDNPSRFEDLIQGEVTQNLASDIGDFIIRRADGYHAYQLAVVVDDAWQKITHIVRGADLLLSTPRQIHLQQLLELPTPVYAHLPLAVDANGRKLSKQYKDAPVENRHPLPALLQALHHLGQPLPDERPTGIDDFWGWAISNWQLENVPAKPTLQPH
ncbi:MAG: glutaminyl-tRNA synthetase [Gammaproteobacteria bacterium (ex Lamellibrachia satsuma)]|nr:MAG: tRNA glutamyl-Q(34) synthetase GluQRS [Gammaproteobacteria bacterium (ex Lamellibrachia satsuma)]RRS34555.1 MAG: glutaminyl-tRNA synthetase [Gammaproteobacteria bacterium (ex Lamellibrachia satsuma)]RRS37454.1 MAG: glutaminyl-tRNA synthetase [Gammaproteobacteria bacterium (ex Lamellibrachia satsuma)]